jgi:hypothetical protein
VSLSRSPGIDGAGKADEAKSGLPVILIGRFGKENFVRVPPRGAVELEEFGHLRGDGASARFEGGVSRDDLPVRGNEAGELVSPEHPRESEGHHKGECLFSHVHILPGEAHGQLTGS